VIHAVPELARHLDRNLQSAREALVRLCEAYRSRRGDIGQVYAVFDGREDEFSGASEQPRGRVTLCFTRAPEEADQRILRLIEAEQPTRCVVVSNDNEVFNNARAFGAGIMSVQEFYKQVRPGSTRRADSSTNSSKAILPTRDAQRITEEYRKHLETRKRRGS